MATATEPRKSASPSRNGLPAAKSFDASRKGAGKTKPEAEILFQSYFKSIGPRTYAAQLKEAENGNHFLVLTEGKRDEKTVEIRKTRLFVFSEDFAEFFKMLHQAAVFIRENPVSDEVKIKRAKFWAKQNGAAKAPSSRKGTG